MRILEAARRCLAQQHPAALSVETIAQAAGVSHRTVYRYFENKEELITAVATHPILPEVPETMRWPDAPGVLRTSWHFMAKRLPELRGERMVPEAAQLRRARFASARQVNERLLADAGVPPGKERDRVLDIVVLLTSSTALLELMDRHGHDVDTSVDLVVNAILRLVSTVQPKHVGGARESDRSR